MTQGMLQYKVSNHSNAPQRNHVLISPGVNKKAAPSFSTMLGAITLLSFTYGGYVTPVHNHPHMLQVVQAGITKGGPQYAKTVLCGSENGYTGYEQRYSTTVLYLNYPSQLEENKMDHHMLPNLSKGRIVESEIVRAGTLPKNVVVRREEEEIVKILSTPFTSERKVPSAIIRAGSLPQRKLNS